MWIIPPKIYLSKELYIDIVNSIYETISEVYNKNFTCTQKGGVACNCLSVKYCSSIGWFLYKFRILDKKNIYRTKNSSFKALVCKTPQKQELISYGICRSQPISRQKSLFSNKDCTFFFRFCAHLEMNDLGKFDLKEKLLTYFFHFSCQRNMLAFKNRKVDKFKKMIQQKYDMTLLNTKSKDKSLKEIQKAIKEEFCVHNKSRDSYADFLRILDSVFDNYIKETDTDESFALLFLESENTIK